MKNFLDNKNASVTPMVCIIMASVFFLNFIMLDAVRIYSLNSVSKRSNDLSASSLLALFYDTLESDYGLYALHAASEAELKNKYYEMIKRNEAELAVPKLLNYEDYPALKLMNYEIGAIDLSMELPLGDIRVLEKQIGNIMKYKSASNIVLKLTEQASAFVKLSGMSDTYAEYMELSELYDRYTSKSHELDLCINGDFSFSFTCVNGFSRLTTVGGRAAEQVRGLIYADSGHVYTEEEADLLKNSFGVFAMPAKTYSEYNYEAIKIAEELLDIIDDSEGKIAEIENWLEENCGEEEYELMYEASMRHMIDKIKKGISSASVRRVSSQASRNKTLLQEAYFVWAELERSIISDCLLDSSELYNALNMLTNAYEKYSDISFSLSQKEMQTADAADYLKEPELDGYAALLPGKYEKVIPHEIYTELPSVKNADGYKYYTISPDDMASINTIQEVKNFLTGSGSIGELIKANLGDITDGYFIDDYIMSYFKAAEGTMTKGTRYLEGEIEYVIAGQQKDSDNITDVYLRLLELRTGFNIIHIICDGEKLELAQSVGESLAAVSGGMGGFLYTAVVIGGWAAAEALADMYELENGRTVPLIKKKGDWYTSVNGKTFGSEFLSAVEINVDEEERNITGASDLLALDYREYLRLLLLQVPERVKLYRIQDLIELNLYKKTNSRMYIGDFYTGIKCSAEFIIGTIIVVDDYGRKRYISEVKSYACT